MNRDEQRIRELEKEIIATDACLGEMRARIYALPASDPTRIGADAILVRLLAGRAAACKALSALVAGV